MRLQLTSFLVFLSTCLLFSQDDFMTDSIKHPKPKQKEPFWTWDKVSFGGSLGAFFGSTTYIDISPTIGYFFHKNLVVGGGPMYVYMDRPYFTKPVNIYGGRLFVRPYLFQGAFLHAEYELMNGNVDLYKPDDRFLIQGMLVGAGYQQSRDGGLYLLMLWDLMGDPYYPFPMPVFRMGFTMGI